MINSYFINLLNSFKTFFIAKYFLQLLILNFIFILTIIISLYLNARLFIKILFQKLKFKIEILKKINQKPHCFY